MIYRPSIDFGIINELARAISCRLLSIDAQRIIDLSSTSETKSHAEKLARSNWLRIR